MSQEIQFNGALTVSKNGAVVSGSASLLVDMTGTNMIANVQNIGTSTEQITFGDVSTPGYAFFKNLDPTNFVMIGLTTAVTSGNAMLKLLPGECALCPTRQTVIYAIADTGACDLLVVIAEL
jgi:hypothetical protein